MKALLLLAPLVLAVPALAQQRTIPYGPPQRAEGVYRTGFESSDFGGCWVTFSERGATEFARLLPPQGPHPGYRGRALQVSWLIRRTPDTSVAQSQGYGHLGMSKCQVEVQRVFSVDAFKQH